MGYWQRWKRPSDIDQGVYANIIKDLRKLLEPLARIGVKLGNGWGAGEPVIDEEHIEFNGSVKCDCTPRRSPAVELLLEEVLGYGEGMYVADPWTVTVDPTDPRSRALFAMAEA